MYKELEKDIDSYNKSNNNGKGSKYRICITDKSYQENYNNIDWSNGEKSNKTN